MCGLVGIVAKEDILGIGEIRLFTDIISHRGPDAEGFYTNKNIALGHRRLSIIDIDNGSQPMIDKENGNVIVFNGEIYNYRILKEQLKIDFNIKFETNSDTEVILKGYEVWGNKVIQYLEGMFSFSLYDKKRNKIIIARDRFGEKPLYYFNNNEKVVWASELKSLILNFPELKVISKEALNLYMMFTFIPAPFTIYENVFKLEAGHFLEINTVNLHIEKATYWDTHLSAPIDLKDYSQAKSELREMLFESVENRMISDVPIGVFLSGGVDSTIIAAIMSRLSETPIKTFSVAYSNQKYDESTRARIVAEHIKSEHYEYLLDYNQLINELDNVILNYDEPFADSSCLPTYYISRKTVNHVKVVLTGDGGDEVFGGYNKYLIHSYGQIIQKFIPSIIKNIINKNIDRIRIGNSDSKGVLTRIKKLLTSIGNSPEMNHLNIISLGFKYNDLKLLLNSNFIPDIQKMILENLLKGNETKIHPSDLKLGRYLDIHTSLEGDMLVKVDRASMLCSLECRAPFLDHKLMDFSFRLPDEFLIKGMNKKRILKDTFEYLLPPNFFNNQKSGFEVPISDWFREELKEDLINTLSRKNLSKHNYFNYDLVHQIIDKHIQEGIDQSSKLWTLFCFQKWYDFNFN